MTGSRARAREPVIYELGQFKMNPLIKLIIILSFWTTSMAYASPMGEKEFTLFFVNQAKHALKGVQFEMVQPLQLNSKNLDGYELTVFLNNAYAQYTSSPTNSQSIIDSQINSIRSQYQSLSTKNNGSIFAVVKNAEYLINVKKQFSQAGLGDKDVPLVYNEINDELYSFFVFDSDNGMRMITKKDLSENKIDRKKIHSIAVKNMSSYFDRKGLSIRRLDKTGSAKVYSVSLDENYEASILLINKYWNKHTFDVSGNIVAFVPARNVVIVTGSNDREGLRIATSLANSGFKELGNHYSPNGYLFEAGTWKPFKP